MGRGERLMKCSFCDAKKVKLNDIIVAGYPYKVCLACQEFDGIKGDSETNE